MRPRVIATLEVVTIAWVCPDPSTYQPAVAQPWYEVRSVYFTDPSGIALEASWWVIDPTGRVADYGDDRLFADDDPVPAFQELHVNGGLTSDPSTRLS